MGRGIVDPVDDFRESNPASNPALLEAIADELERGELPAAAAGAVDLELSDLPAFERPGPEQRGGHDGTSRGRRSNCCRRRCCWTPWARRSGVRFEVKGLPAPFRAIQYPGVRSGVEFLEVFGKPDRLLTCECERSEETTLAQAFQLINGEVVRECLGSAGEPGGTAAGVWQERRGDPGGAVPGGLEPVTDGRGGGPDRRVCGGA